VPGSGVLPVPGKVPRCRVRAPWEASFSAPPQGFAALVLGLGFGESRTGLGTVSPCVVDIGVPPSRDEKYLQLETGVAWEASC